MKKHLWTLPLTIVFLFIGILISLQFQSQSLLSSDLSVQRTETLIAMVRDLSGKRQQLAAEVLDLNSRLNVQRQNSEDEKVLYDSLSKELVKLQKLTGQIPLEGPGISITIEKIMPILYIDIIQFINELWSSGAEAISVNQFRITQNSSVFYTESENVMSVTVNNIVLSYPITIKAIGSTNNLEKALTIPGGIMDKLALYGAYPAIALHETLTVPAVNSVPDYYFLREYKPPEVPAAATIAQ